MWKRHHCRWRAAKFRPMLGAQGLWAGRDLYRATPTVTSRLPPFRCLLRHTRRCWESILTQVHMGTIGHVWKGMLRTYSNPDPQEWNYILNVFSVLLQRKKKKTILGKWFPRGVRGLELNHTAPLPDIYWEFHKIVLESVGVGKYSIFFQNFLSVICQCLKKKVYMSVLYLSCIHINEQPKFMLICSLPHAILMPSPWNGQGHIVLPFVILSCHNWFPFIISWTVAHI